MRLNPTRAEAVLSDAIVGRQCGDMKFRRQTVMLGWILDFYCPSSRIAIEADGGYHAGRVEQDKLRDRVLFEKHGVITLRFPNNAIMADIDAVLDPVFALHLDLPKYNSGTQGANRKRAMRILQDHKSVPAVSVFINSVLNGRCPQVR